MWYDQDTVLVGESLSETIDRGLVQARSAIVIISPSFLSKPWTRRELQGLVAKEITGGAGKVILPVWHQVTHGEIAGVSPPLADLRAASTSEGLDAVLLELTRALELKRRTRYLETELISLEPDRAQIAPGDSLRLSYVVERGGVSSEPVWLGASLLDGRGTEHVDRDGDLSVELGPGRATFTRPFTVPWDAEPGQYRLVGALWYGVTIPDGVRLQTRSASHKLVVRR